MLALICILISKLKRIESFQMSGGITSEDLTLYSYKRDVSKAHLSI